MCELLYVVLFIIISVKIMTLNVRAFRLNNSEFFTAKELSCKCGCGTGEMDGAFLKTLDNIRREFGKPIHLSSAYRCPKHNKQVSRSGLSGAHTTGKAVDILCSGKDSHEILSLSLEEGISRIGLSQKGKHASRFIHIDGITDHNLSPWVWTY